VIVVTCDWDCNKGITNPNGVFSGVTRTIGGQKGSRTPTLYNMYLVSYSVNIFNHISELV
jgi:hypothetical protein